MSLFDLSASTNSRKVPILNADYPQDVTMNAIDGNATFTAVIAKDGRPDKYTYQWYVDGAAVSGATAAEYVRNVSSDKGVHTVWCEVSNKAGTVRTREAKLTVKKVPVLNASYPQKATVTVGNSATFEVKIAEAGYPDSYTYQWYADGKAVSGATKSSYTRAGSSVGYYDIYCIVTNKAGYVQSRTAGFTIEEEYVFSDGWFLDGNSWGASTTSPNGWVIGEDGCVYIHCDGPYATLAWTNNPVNFTGKNKLVFYCKHFVNAHPNNVGTIYFGVSSTQDDYDFVAATSVSGHNGGGEWYSVDVSHLSGSYYIKIAIIRTGLSNADSVYIEDIYFE